jgi:glycosyltransferase involved in cell wall biosynthesis
MASRRILFYIHGMAGGGAERVFALLASQLAKGGHSIIMVNDFNAVENTPYLHRTVRSIVIGRHHIRGIWRLFSVLKQEKPDVIFAALGASNLKMTIAKLLTGRKSALILTYHSKFAVERRPLGRLGYIATPVITRLADWTVAVSRDLAAYLVQRWWASARTSCIHNPISVPHPHESLRESLTSRSDMILAVGRLAPEKEFLSLVRAFARLLRPTAQLIILGEGPDRSKLEAEVTRLELQGRVSLPGYVSEPWRYFEQAKCLVLTSRYESFGNVIVEALAYGLPVISTNCAGPQEILDNGQFGTLVPVGDVNAIAAAIENALENPGDPLPRQERAAQFATQEIAKQYETLLETLLEGKRTRSAISRWP